MASIANLPLTDHQVALDYLKNALNPKLVTKLELDINQPTIFEDWVKLAIKYDRVYRRSLLLKQGARRPISFFSSSQNGNKRPARDPNAMDVDTLSVEKRNELYQKRACFNCERTGHISRDCRAPRRNNNSYSNASSSTSNIRPLNRFSTQKQSPEEAARSLRALFSQYTGEEEDQIFKAYEKMAITPDFQ